jgi:hypothetical protein
MRTILLAIYILTLADPSLLAQETRSSVGTLIGHVICSDTNGPARFAKVWLVSVAPSKTSAEEPATADADGIYFFKAVPSGTYYVHAQMSGYADPITLFNSADFASTDPAIHALIAKAAPSITINDTEAARMDLRIDRGASISGRILYDDGAPAQNWAVFAQRPPKDSHRSEPALSNVRSGTDDLGYFRLSGLPAGEYILIASYQDSMLHGLNAGTMRQDHIAIVVFSGSTSFASKAQTIAVGPGDARTGVDITVPLNNLHRIKGQVLAKSDSRPATYGTVMLFTDESTIVSSAAILADGSFTLDFVPGNTAYTLRVQQAGEEKMWTLPNGTVSRSSQQFGPTSSQIILRDSNADNIIIAVPEPSATLER